MPNWIQRAKDYFKQGWEKLIGRINLWRNQGNSAYNSGIVDSEPAADEPRYMWVLGATERHCRDCLELNGQIKTASEWRAAGIQPQSPDLQCGGWNCDCSLVQVTGDIE